MFERREGRDLRKVGFYDPITNQTYLNLPAILEKKKRALNQQEQFMIFQRRQGFLRN
uniref:Uncharacterized protein n=1 Tax=Brassica campestris TaxID=3711 RepID=A0A3P6DVN2_BRACM|nr:unnamed protein product [Brassica rapa]